MIVNIHAIVGKLAMIFNFNSIYFPSLWRLYDRGRRVVQDSGGSKIIFNRNRLVHIVARGTSENRQNDDQRPDPQYALYLVRVPQTIGLEYPVTATSAGFTPFFTIVFMLVARAECSIIRTKPRDEPG